jgi:hypothetical protein
MILSYSLDVRHVPHCILFYYNVLFLYVNFIIKDDEVFCRSYMCNFIPKSVAVWDKFSTHIKVIIKAEKIINDTI